MAAHADLNATRRRRAGRRRRDRPVAGSSRSEPSLSRRRRAVGRGRGGLLSAGRSACRSIARGGCESNRISPFRAHPEVFVIGDLATLTGDRGQPLPGVAQVAIQMGGTPRAISGAPSRGGHSPIPLFRFREHGHHRPHFGHCRISAPFTLKGYPAWLAWLFVHLVNLIGFRNRLVVLVQWAWAYFSYQRAIRLITGGHPPAPRAPGVTRRTRPHGIGAAPVAPDRRSPRLRPSLPFQPLAVERIYSTCVYPAIQRVLTPAPSNVSCPLALLDVAVVMLIGPCWSCLILFARRPGKGHRVRAPSASLC